MSYIMVDVEADGPCPGEYSMFAIGAVIVEPTLSRTFHGLLRPVSEKWLPRGLEICGIARKTTLGYPDAAETMQAFGRWVRENGGERPIFVSDNNGFDWQFVNWYFHRFTGTNPFGHSSMNLGSLYKGLVRNLRQNFKHLRRTRHTHNPLDDAMGNAEAMLQLMQEYGLDSGGGKGRGP
jgi:hypothetical protein